ncbi:histamine N-methyltransferase-like [Glandiceps talaboti]
MATLDLQVIESDPTYYHKVHNKYNENFSRDEEEWERIWKENNNMYTFDESKEDEICILSVGPGEGTREVVILESALKRHPKVYLRVIEPEQTAVDIFKDKCTKLQETFPGLRVDWYVKTFQDYMKDDDKESEMEKFNFIICLHSLYYMDDLSAAMDFLYKYTKPGGIIAITMIDTNSTLGKLYEKNWKDDNYPVSLTSANDVRLEIKKKGWTLESRYNWGRVDVTSLLDNPESEDGNMVLDFTTHIINFRNTAPKALLNEVLSCFEENYEMKDGRKRVSNDRAELVIKKPAH